MIRTASFTLATFLVTANLIAASSPIRLSISLEPAAEIPAIPVTLRVEAQNQSGNRAVLPNAVAMQVTPRHAQPFVAIASLRGEVGVTTFPGVNDYEITLGAGERRDLSFWSSLDSPLFTRDARLYEPGEYRLQLFVDADLEDLDYLDVQSLADVEKLQDAITSNEVTLTVTPPTGADAIVFRWFKALPSSRPYLGDLAERVWVEQPTSRYAPYAVPGNLTDRVREVAFLKAAIAKAPETPMSDWHRLYLAALSDDYPHLRTEEDVARATEMAAYVREVLTDLVGRARDPRVLQAAQKALTEVPTRDGFVYQLRLNRGELTDIEPTIICVSEPAGKKRVAWLSYYNPSPQRKISPVGERNKFTPPPFDRGQPTEFVPNVPTAAHLFKVSFDSPTLTWHIDASNLRIEPKSAPRVCPADMDLYYVEYFNKDRDWPDSTDADKQ